MKEQRTFQNPFSPSFLETWQLWKDFRKEEHNFSYKGVISEQMAIKRLCEVSDGDEEKATRIVNQSISRGWMDFYQLKQPSANGKSSTKKPKQPEPKPNSVTDDTKVIFMQRLREREQESGGGNSQAM